MYAVIKTGGKQYKVEEGDKLRVEKLEFAKGDEITFDQVLFIGGDEYILGKPVIEGATVKAKVVRQMRGPKVLIFKMKRRKGYHKKQGHRQSLTEIAITGITKGA
jgi:large subunit ribosomal protein L21